MAQVAQNCLHLMVHREQTACSWANVSSHGLCSRHYSSISSVYTCSERAVCSGLTADGFARARPALPRSAGRSHTLAFGHYKLRGLKSWCEQSRQRDGFFSYSRGVLGPRKGCVSSTQNQIFDQNLAFPCNSLFFDFFPLFPLQSFKPDFAQNHQKVTKERVLVFAFRQLPYPLNQIIRWATQLTHHFFYLVTSHVLNIWKSLIDNLNWLRGKIGFKLFQNRVSFPVTRIRHIQSEIFFQMGVVGVSSPY